MELLAGLEMAWRTQLCTVRRLMCGEGEEHVVVRRRWCVVSFDNVDSAVWNVRILVTGEGVMGDV